MSDRIFSQAVAAYDDLIQARQRMEADAQGDGVLAARQDRTTARLLALSVYAVADYLRQTLGLLEQIRDAMPKDKAK